METSRRGFIQIAGLAALGLVVAKPAIDLFSGLHSDAATNSTIWAPVSTATKRLGMLIDITACSNYQEEHGDCAQCTDACHLWHNVPTPNVNSADFDREEELKWIWEDKYGRVFEELLIPHVDEENEEKINLPVTLLCNQCTNPPCIKYCPTRATWKRESDGIVMVDFHRCIGCRYCMAGCPYGARSFNWRDPRKVLDEDKLNLAYPTRTRGVVEKCNFCADRLDKLDANGNPMIPACVQACQQIGANALIFGDLLDETSEISQRLKSANNVMRRLPELGTNPNNYYILE